MKAMIFAAGLGTRLGELTRSTPKALIDINGRTLLAITADRLARAGFDDLLVNVHHHPDQMTAEIAKLRHQKYHITISDESDRLLDTAGGLLNARHFFDENPFLCHNVDQVTDADLTELYHHHTRSGALATLAVRHRPGNRMLLADSSGRLCGWRNKATREQIVTVDDTKELDEVGFSGIQVLSPAILEMIPQGIYSLTSLYIFLAGRNLINTWLHDQGYWFDAGTPASLAMIREYMAGGEKQGLAAPE